MKSYWANIYVRNGKTQCGLEHDTRLEAVENAICCLAISKAQYDSDTTLNSRVRVTLK